MSEMSRRLAVYLARSIALSLLLFVYYSNFHINWMDPYPNELHGFWAYLACLLVSLPLVHLAVHLRRSFSELLHLLHPTIMTIAIALVVLLLTPLLNFLWFPFPVGYFVMRVIDTSRISEISAGTAAALAVLAVLAYLMTCLSKRTAARRRGAPEIIPLYLWTVYVVETLFVGIYYI